MTYTQAPVSRGLSVGEVMTVPISNSQRRKQKLRVASPPASECTACRDRTWILGSRLQVLFSSQPAVLPHLSLLILLVHLEANVRLEQGLATAMERG